MAWLLFVAKRVDGVGARDLDRVAGDGAERDGERERAGEDEGAGPEVDPRVEIVEPVAHQPPGGGPGDQIGDDHRLGELPGEQFDDVAGAGAEYLADADLLGAALGG